ncbi:RNA recognition motif protein [Ceratobasidium sp. AG-Ba]|nr:RNA recognition motif protein [Ceratobasidium sp. AG-Ba]
MNSSYNRRGGAARAHSDYRSYSARQRILGPTASRVPPAWRHGGGSPYQRPRPAPSHESELVTMGGGYANLPQQEGSKIYISHLPPDVDDVDVKQLLTETIGPLIYSFIVCDSRGVTRMAAVASFVDPSHAAKAVELYNGKVIDGKEPIRVEQIGFNPKARQLVSVPVTANGGRANNVASSSKPTANSLLSRVSKAPAPTVSTSLLDRVSARPIVTMPPKRPAPPVSTPMTTIAPNSHAPPKGKRFVKKGPKRLQKVNQQTQLQQLEMEMDQYRNSAPSGLGLQ